MSKTYRVRLVRPVFETTIVEVEANGEDDAVLEALCQAEEVPAEEWSGTFDPDSYFYDVHYVQEVTPETEEFYLKQGVDDDRKYLLLRGDLDSGSGAMPFQPWLADISDFMVIDLCNDWGENLITLEQAGVASFYGPFDRASNSKKKVPAKVIPFRRPKVTTDEKDS